MDPVSLNLTPVKTPAKHPYGDAPARVSPLFDSPSSPGRGSPLSTATSTVPARSTRKQGQAAVSPLAAAEGVWPHVEQWVSAVRASLHFDPRALGGSVTVRQPFVVAVLANLCIRRMATN
jgi:hypothetical protein